MGVLEIFGVIFLVVLVIAAYFAFKVYRWFKQSGWGESDYGSVWDVLPPIRMEFIKYPHPDWINLERVRTDCEMLKKAGFIDCGTYETTMGQAASILHLWVNKKNGLYAILMEARTYPEGLDEPICDYASELLMCFADNSTLLLTNNRHANALPRPEHHRSVMIEAQTIKELFPHLKPNIPKGIKVKPVINPVNAVINFCNEYHSWLWEEAQLRSPEISELFQMLKIEVTDEMIEQLLETAEYEKTLALSDDIVKRLSKSSGMTADKWESLRERLVVVHDKLNANQLVDCFYDLLDVQDDKELDMIDAIGDMTSIHSPVEVFSEHLAKLKRSSSVKRLATTREPVAAHVYVRPVENRY